MGSAITNSKGNYKIAFFSELKSFNVSASYTRHITTTKTIKVYPID